MNAGACVCVRAEDAAAAGGAALRWMGRQLVACANAVSIAVAIGQGDSTTAAVAIASASAAGDGQVGEGAQ